MDFKDLSPAFLTSLASILFGAIFIGTGTGLLVILGWFLLVAGLGLNVFSALVSLQKLKGGPLPAMIADQGEVLEPTEEKEANTFEDPSPDTEAQPVLARGYELAGETEEKIFRSRAPRARTR